MLTYNVLNEYVERLKKQDMPVMATTDNITNLTGDDIAKLRVGDVVVKQTGNMKHLYLVTYKEENIGICLTYADATYIETVSYDYNGTTRQWTYNSTDATQVQPKLTAGDNVTINNNVISATDTKYTAGTNITITDGVISASGGTKYKHSITITYAGSQSSAHVFLNYETDENVIFTKTSSTNTFAEHLYNRGIRNKDTGLMVSGTYYINSEGIERPCLCIYAISTTGFAVVDLKASDNTEVIHNFSGTGANIFMTDNII